MSVSYGGDSIVFADGSVNSSGFIGHRNRIINGAMGIDQRSAGASVSSINGKYLNDRWYCTSYNGTSTAIQSSTAPTGFVKSQLITNVTSTALGGANWTYTLSQAIEGHNIADLGFGTASASTVTLSFWVRSSLTGQYSVALANGLNTGATRSYVANYTINVADTWEKKTVTIAGDTSGTWGSTTSAGIYVNFDLTSGTDFNTTANAWQAGAYMKTTGNATFNLTTNGTWYVTGVQLEVGSTATSFEYRPYGMELALCQRYFEVCGNGMMGAWGDGSSYASMQVLYKVTKRAGPTLSLSTSTPSADDINSGGTSATGATIGLLAGSGVGGAHIAVGGFSAHTLRVPIVFTTDAILASAEL